MTDQNSDPGHDPEADTVSHVHANGGAPTETLVSGAVGDRCVACGTPLSSDQRYCVVCGERRGASRFSLPDAPTQEQATRTDVRRGGRRRLSGGTGFGSGATLIAGVGTLLLAMLVGVLIGHNTANTKTVASNNPVKVIKIDEGGGSPAAATSTPAAGSSTGASSSHKKATKSSKAKKHSAPPVSKATASKESSAASKVTGGSGGVPSTVTVGATGSGAGYSKKTHKFNGSFFGQ